MQKSKADFASRGMQGSSFDVGTVGQTEVAKAAKGMLVAFIDFSKAYDTVNRGKMWGCLEQLGVNGKFLSFLKALY